MPKKTRPVAVGNDSSEAEALVIAAAVIVIIAIGAAWFFINRSIDDAVQKIQREIVEDSLSVSSRIKSLGCVVQDLKETTDKIEKRSLMTPKEKDEARKIEEEEAKGRMFYFLSFFES